MGEKVLIKQANPPEWRKVPGFELAYEVSECGDVRRIGKGRGVSTGRILKAQLINSGYLIVMLYKNNVQYPRLVHRIVADAFIGPCPAGHEVNHINMGKTDNHWRNLEYVSRSGNLLHRSRLGVGRGEKNGTAKLTEESVREIRRRHANGEGYKSLGKSYGVAWEAVRNLIKKRTWAWVE